MTREEILALADRARDGFGALTELLALAATQAGGVAAGAAPAVAPGQFITPEAAAEIAGVPVSRIYAWSKDQRWAIRPTRRCLRIEEAGFRRWYASKGGR